MTNSDIVVIELLSSLFFVDQARKRGEPICEMDAWIRIELTNGSFADSCLTTWLPCELN